MVALQVYLTKASNMRPFPVLLSIPHGGDQIPPEVVEHTVISRHAILADSDVFTREIYGIKEDVAVIVDTQIARVVVDLNRDQFDLPPSNPDGVVKHISCHGAQIYRDELWRDRSKVNQLLECYYHPYHRNIQSILNSRQDLELMLDCHSMEAVGPVIGPDQGAKRPAICLGGRYGQSCGFPMINSLASALRQAFELTTDEVIIDEPFAGGYITRRYGNNPLPCIQIEMSRGLYLDSDWLTEHNGQPNLNKITDLRQKFRYALELFFA